MYDMYTYVTVHIYSTLHFRHLAEKIIWKPIYEQYVFSLIINWHFTLLLQSVI